MSSPRERIPQPGRASMLWTTLGLTGVTIVAAAAQPAAAVSPSALQACASIAADNDRLACYDRLAGRAVPSAAAPLVQASPAAGVPAVAPTPAAVAIPPVATASSAAPLPVTPSQAAFGLYEAEHPKPPPVAVAASLKARVIALGRTAEGRMSVSLEGGAVWEIDQADPLLAIGDTVTLSRAAFGSYLMHTPTGRTHRAQRQR